MERGGTQDTIYRSNNISRLLLPEDYGIITGGNIASLVYLYKRIEYALIQKQMKLIFISILFEFIHSVFDLHIFVFLGTVYCCIL